MLKCYLLPVNRVTKTADVVVVTNGCKDERIGGMCQVVLVVRLGKQQGIVGTLFGRRKCIRQDGLQ